MTTTEMKYDTAIFDLDGTLLNTLDDLCDSTNFALKKCGYPQRGINEIRYFVGNGIYKLIERAVPDNTDKSKTDECFEIFKKHYKDNLYNKTKPYKGIIELLTLLKENGIKIAVVTNKADFAASRLCKKYFDGLTDVCIGASEGVRKKPYPDSVFLALDKLSSKKDKAVYVGDSEVDIETAANSGLPCISVLWGFREKKELLKAGAVLTAQDTDELGKLILF